MTNVALMSTLLTLAGIGLVWMFVARDPVGFFNNSHPFPEGVFGSLPLTLSRMLWAVAGLLALGLVGRNTWFVLGWRHAARVPTIFADGRTVAQRTASWLPGWVQAALTGRRLDRPLQDEIFPAVLWWAVPIATTGLLAVYVQARDRVGAALLALLVATELAFSYWIAQRAGRETARAISTGQRGQPVSVVPWR